MEEEKIKDLEAEVKRLNEEIVKLKEHNQVLIKTAMKQKQENLEMMERMKKLE